MPQMREPVARKAGEESEKNLVRCKTFYGAASTTVHISAANWALGARNRDTNCEFDNALWTNYNFSSAPVLTKWFLNKLFFFTYGMVFGIR